MKRSLFFVQAIMLITLLLVMMTSCDLFKKDNPVSPSGDDKIELGDEIKLLDVQANSGSVITVSKPGNQLDGLTILIDDGAFTGSRSFKISSYEIKKHEFGVYVNPISPLIKIAGNGGYADNVYELKIPVNIDDGSFPIVFIYDENIKKLEPLPVKEYDKSSVTVLTRHFSTSSITGGSSVSKDTPYLQSSESYTKLFVSSMQESLIKQTPVISSGFKPGTDDWEFTNYGSHTAPGGHCAGQNLGAFWYYHEKKLKGEPNLFGLLKKHSNQSLWQENNRGYRFCSVLQKDIDWDGFVNMFFWEYIDLKQEFDKLKYLTIAGAMLVTGEPQNIEIYRQIGTLPNGNPKYSGHSLICYQIEPTNGKLLISDPNYPAVSQTITYLNDRFLPYEGKLKADDVVHPFPFITYNAKTALIDWNTIGKRWKEIENYQIGSVAPNKFISYQLWSPDNGGFEITDEIFIEADTLNIRAKIPGIEVGYSIDGEMYGDVLIFDENGDKLLDKETSQIKIRVNEPSTLKRGIYIIGNKEVAKYSNGKYIPLFIDFKWITIHFQKYQAKIVPNSMTGEARTEFTWNLDVSKLPDNMKYFITWNMGENKPIIRKNNENFITHTYETPGNYKIIATLYDESNNKILARDTANAEITGTGGVSPTYGPAGQTVYITGSGFGNRNDGDEVTLHWTKDETNHEYRALNVIDWKDNKIEVVVTDESKNYIGKVYLKVRKYNSSNSKYTWIGPWEYEIKKLIFESVSPDTVSPGKVLTLNGSGFGPKGVKDYIFFNSTPITDYIIWNDNKIEFVVIDMPRNEQITIDLVKSCQDINSRYSGKIHRYDNYIYWVPNISDIVKLLKNAKNAYGSSLSYSGTSMMTFYNFKGDSTGFKELTDNDYITLHLSNDLSNHFSSDGTGFSFGFNYPGNDGNMFCEGTVSQSGKILEIATIIRKDKKGNIILKMVVENLPLFKYGMFSPNFSWEFSAKENFSSYITEYYKASYFDNGAISSKTRMISATKIEFNLSGLYGD